MAINNSAEYGAAGSKLEGRLKVKSVYPVVIIKYVDWGMADLIIEDKK